MQAIAAAAPAIIEDLLPSIQSIYESQSDATTKFTAAKKALTDKIAELQKGISSMEALLKRRGIPIPKGGAGLSMRGAGLLGDIGKMINDIVMSARVKGHEARQRSRLDQIERLTRRYELLYNAAMGGGSLKSLFKSVGKIGKDFIKERVDNYVTAFQNGGPSGALLQLSNDIDTAKRLKNEVMRNPEQLLAMGRSLMAGGAKKLRPKVGFGKQKQAKLLSLFIKVGSYPDFLQEYGKERWMSQFNRAIDLINQPGVDIPESDIAGMEMVLEKLLPYDKRKSEFGATILRDKKALKNATVKMIRNPDQQAMDLTHAHQVIAKLAEKSISVPPRARRTISSGQAARMLANRPRSIKVTDPFGETTEPKRRPKASMKPGSRPRSASGPAFSGDLPDLSDLSVGDVSIAQQGDITDYVKGNGYRGSRRMMAIPRFHNRRVAMLKSGL